MKYLIAVFLVSFLSPNIVFGDEHDQAIVRAIYKYEIYKEIDEAKMLALFKTAGLDKVERKQKLGWVSLIKEQLKNLTLKIGKAVFCEDNIKTEIELIKYRLIQLENKNEPLNNPPR